MKTCVYIMFNGADKTIYFPMDKKTFMSRWDNHVIGCGYLTMDDEEGNTVVINPSNCGVVDISEVKKSPNDIIKEKYGDLHA